MDYNKLIKLIDVKECDGTYKVAVKSVALNLNRYTPLTEYKDNFSDYVSNVVEAELHGYTLNNRIKYLKYVKNALYKTVKSVEDAKWIVNEKLLNMIIFLSEAISVTVPLLAIMGRTNVEVFNKLMEIDPMYGIKTFNGIILLTLIMLTLTRKLSKNIVYLLLMKWNYDVIRDMHICVNTELNKIVEEPVKVSGYSEDITNLENKLNNFKLIASSKSEKELYSSLDSLLKKIKKEPKRIAYIQQIYNVYLDEIIRLIGNASEMSEDNLDELNMTILNCKKYVDKVENELYDSIQNDSSVTMHTLNNIFKEGVKADDV